MENALAPAVPGTGETTGEGQQGEQSDALDMGDLSLVKARESIRIWVALIPLQMKKHHKFTARLTIGEASSRITLVGRVRSRIAIGWEPARALMAPKNSMRNADPK